MFLFLNHKNHNTIKNKKISRNTGEILGAEDRGRTGTRSYPRRILSPVRLPIPPLRRLIGGTTQIRTGDEGFADLSLTTWLWCHIFKLFVKLRSVDKKMERKTRFELATFALARQRSTTEPLPHT